MVACVLFTGAGIDVPSYSFNFLRNFQGCSSLGAFEEHMFDKMTDATFRFKFTSTANSYPNTDADTGHMRHFNCGKAKAIWEVCDVVHLYSNY